MKQKYCEKRDGHFLGSSEAYEGAEWHKAMFFTDEIFFMFNRTVENIIYFCLRHVGLLNKKTNYKYEVSINKQDESGSISVGGITKSL
jgi:hypothetical protein